MVFRILIAGAVVLFATGCSPTLSIGGAYYPAWLVCIASGIVGAMICRAILIKTDWDSHLKPRALVYPSLASFLSLLVWFFFFRP